MPNYQLIEKLDDHSVPRPARAAGAPRRTQRDKIYDRVGWLHKGGGSSTNVPLQPPFGGGTTGGIGESGRFY
jgi:hypothetical protein